MHAPQSAIKRHLTANSFLPFYIAVRSQPFKFLLLGLEWMLTEMLIELSRIRIWALSAAVPDYGDPDYAEVPSHHPHPSVTKSKVSHRGKGAEGYEAEEYFKADQERKAREVNTTFYPCDKRSELYVMNKTFIKEEHARSPRSSITEAR
jgi:hypothetical protein